MRRREIQTFGIGNEFVQDNVSRSRRCLVRGLQGDGNVSKLVYALSGDVFGGSATPEGEIGVLRDDPDLNINWTLSGEPIFSKATA